MRWGVSPSLGILAHHVEGAAVLEPLQLLLVVCVVHLELVGGAVLLLALDVQGLPGGEGGEAHNGDLVGGVDLVIVGRVVEGQAQHALLLQVGLVDAGKALDDDCATACTSSKPALVSMRPRWMLA